MGSNYAKHAITIRDRALKKDRSSVVQLKWAQYKCKKDKMDPSENMTFALSLIRELKFEKMILCVAAWGSNRLQWVCGQKYFMRNSKDSMKMWDLVVVEALELDVSVEVAVAERSNGYNELLPDLSREKRVQNYEKSHFHWYGARN